MSSRDRTSRVSRAMPREPGKRTRRKSQVVLDLYGVLFRFPRCPWTVTHYSAERVIVEEKVPPYRLLELRWLNRDRRKAP